MFRTMGWSCGVLSLVVLFGCEPAGSEVKGQVVFSDGADASGLVVLLSGAEQRAVTTQADGAFTFTHVKDGSYVASVEAAATLEGRASVGVTAPAAGALELRLTSAGALGGLVSFGGAPVPGASVSLAGTPLTATTDGAGRFRFERLPAGTVELVASARAPSGQLRAASLAATVTRAGAADVTLSLVEEAAPTATLEGSIGFVGPQSPTAITISVPGTSATTTVGADGRFSLTVPAGRWPVVASARHHPQQLLATPELHGGETVTLPPAVLSFYAPLLELTGFVSVTGVLASHTPWYAVAVTDNGVDKVLLVDSAARTARVVVNGTIARVRFSSRGKYLVFAMGGSIYTWEVATGALVVRGEENGAFSISTDETVLFRQRGATAFERIKLSDGTTQRFPVAFGNMRRHTDDRWSYGNIGLDDLFLVTSSGEVPVATSVNRVSSDAQLWALHHCATSCRLSVVDPASDRVSEVTALAGGLVNYRGGVGRFGIFENPDPWLVDFADGSALRLDAGATTVRFNADGTRYTWWAGGRLHEGASSTTTPAPELAHSLTLGFGAYFSPRRFVSFDDDPLARRVVDVRDGVVSIDTDVATPGVFEFAPNQAMAAWSRRDGTIAAIVGDSPARTIPGLGPFTLSGAPRCGTIGGDPAFGSSWLIDATRPEVIRLPARPGPLPAIVNGTFDVLFLRQGNVDVAWDCATRQLLSVGEQVSFIAAPGDDEAVFFDVPLERQRLLRLGVVR